MAVSAAFADSHGLWQSWRNSGPLANLFNQLSYDFDDFHLILLSAAVCGMEPILPLFDTSVRQLASASARMGFTITGFEVIYFLYRHVSDKDKVMRYTQASILFTNVIYLIIMLVSVVYFSERQMLKTIWGSINLLKIIKYPFLERLEFIAIPVWMFVVLPGIMLTAWIVMRGAAHLFGWNRKCTAVP